MFLQQLRANIQQDFALQMIKIPKVGFGLGAMDREGWTLCDADPDLMRFSVRLLLQSVRAMTIRDFTNQYGGDVQAFSLAQVQRTAAPRSESSDQVIAAAEEVLATVTKAKFVVESKAATRTRVKVEEKKADGHWELIFA